MKKASNPSPRAVRVHLVDHGQDFLWWDIQAGKVVDCGPFQAFAWVGTKVLNPTLKAGVSLRIVTNHGDRLTLKYPVEKLEPAKTRHVLWTLDKGGHTLARGAQPGVFATATGGARFAIRALLPKLDPEAPVNINGGIDFVELRPSAPPRTKSLGWHCWEVSYEPVARAAQP